MPLCSFEKTSNKMKECPITLCPLSELSNPVAFSFDLDQPYELDALCTWMEANPVNPLTGREAHIGDLVALGGFSQQQSSAELMERRNLTIIANQEFRNEVKDIKAELGQLNDKIRDVNKTMSVLMGEKTRIDTRIEFLNKQFVNKDQDTCPHCVIA